jgi:hypothetical protein
MECDYRESDAGRGFDEVSTLMEMAETLGLDGIWLAERHSPPVVGCLTPGTGIHQSLPRRLSLWPRPLPPVQTMRVGIAVTVLPLIIFHPRRRRSRHRRSKSAGAVWIGSVVALPQSLRRRLTPSPMGAVSAFGKRSIILKAWTEERFSHAETLHGQRCVCCRSPIRNRTLRSVSLRPHGTPFPLLAVWVIRSSSAHGFDVPR